MSASVHPHPLATAFAPCGLATATVDQATSAIRRIAV
jgi:hypothetical protein